MSVSFPDDIRITWPPSLSVSLSALLSTYGPNTNPLYPSAPLAHTAICSSLCIPPYAFVTNNTAMSSRIAITNPNPTTTSSSTNGSSASIYGTTPGGTPRISYSRDQLLNLASSPLSRSPPNFDVPAAISRTTPKLNQDEERFEHQPPASNAIQEGKEDEEDGGDEATAFAMDL